MEALGRLLRKEIPARIQANNATRDLHGAAPARVPISMSSKVAAASV
jgi:hypothetical protein